MLEDSDGCSGQELMHLGALKGCYRKQSKGDRNDNDLSWRVQENLGECVDRNEAWPDHDKSWVEKC